MNWDSHRYLKSFFALPMMGAVLHTINMRLSAEQVLYTINHAADRLILVNREFAQIAGLLNAHSQREMIPGRQSVYLVRPWNDNGCRVTGFVERVGLDDECRPLFLAGLVPVGLRFKVDGPDLTLPDSRAHSRPSEALRSMDWAAEAL